MNAEIDRELRKTELGKYLAEACKSDPETDEAVEAAYKEAYQEGILQEGAADRY